MKIFDPIYAFKKLGLLMLAASSNLGNAQLKNDNNDGSLATVPSDPISHQQNSSYDLSGHFDLSYRSMLSTGKSRASRQPRQARNNNMLLDFSPSARSKAHACHGHKIIFHHNLLKDTLNTTFPLISTATLHSLIDDHGQINLNEFIAWYTSKSSFSVDTVNQNRAKLEIMLRAINFEQTQQTWQDRRVAQIAYVFDIAEHAIANLSQDISEVYSVQDLFYFDVIQTLQDKLDQDIVIRWYDDQRWSDIVKIVSMGDQSSNIDCRTLETFQKKYQHLSQKKFNLGNEILSTHERQIFKDLSLFWEKRLSETLENARQIIHQSIQPTVQHANYKEQDKKFTSLPKFSFSPLKDQEDFRHQPTKGPLFKVDLNLNGKNLASGLALFAHAIQHTFGASFLIQRIGQSTITLAPLDSNRRTYGVLIDDQEVSYQSLFDYLLTLSFHLDETTLAKFLYKALSQGLFDSRVLEQLERLGHDIHSIKKDTWAWILHTAVCREQEVPGTWIRVMRLLEAAIQQDNHSNLLDIEDNEGEIRHLNIVQLFNPQDPFLNALSGQNEQRRILLSRLPQLKKEYDDFENHLTHCTCEVGNQTTMRTIRSPKKEVRCSQFTEHLSTQLKNDPRYLAERDLIPRQEFESIKRYGVDNIDKIRILSEGNNQHKAEQIKQDAIKKTQEDLEKIMTDHYSQYKKLRKKETNGKELTQNESHQLLDHAKNIAADQQKKINKGIELVNLDIQKAFLKEKQAHPDLQRSDFPELKTVQVTTKKDTRPTAKTPLLEIKIPTGGNFAETLSAVGKSILYVEGDLQLTYRIVMDDIGSFDFRVMGKKSLKNTNDQKWRIETKNKSSIQTKLEITGLYIGGQAPTYSEIFNDIKPLFSTDNQSMRSDKEIAKFILDFMDKGIFSSTELTRWSLSSDQIDSIKRGLTQWLLLQTISEEQRTTGTYAEVKRVLQEYAMVENIHDSTLVAIPIKDRPQEKKAPRLVDLFDPTKKLLTFMLTGGASLHRNQFQSPSQFLSNTLTPESVVKELKQSRQIFENLQTSPIQLPTQLKITEDQVASVKKIMSVEQIIQHQDSMQELIDTVKPLAIGKRVYASILSESTSSANAEEPAVKKRLTIITTAGCSASSHTIRIKREICEEHFESQEVEVSNALFEKNKQTLEFLHNQGKALNAAYEIKDDVFTRRSDSTDEMAQSGLNAMYVIQALMEIDQQDSRPATQSIIKLHTYLGWAQVMQGSAQDANHLITLIQKINHPNLVEIPSLFGRALGNLGKGLQLASIGLDITELATAKTSDQRVQAGMRLFFDSSGLLVNGGTLIAEMGGIEGAAEIGGVFAVPAAGLGIGITALAFQYQHIRDDVEQIGHQFELYQNAYKKGYNIKNNTLFFDGSEVLTKIDLIAGKIERGTHSIYPTRDPVAWGYWSVGVKNYDFIPWAGDMPRIERNRERAIHLMETLGWPVEKNWNNTKI